MATLYSPRIVTDGLVLCLDAGNRRSYPGSGTSWTDMSGNGNTGTLTNGPTFNGADGGRIIHDGVNDYTEIQTRNTNIEFQPTQPFSVFCWIYNLASGSGAVLANVLGSAPYPGWDLWRNVGGGQGGGIAMHLISSWSANAIKIKVDFDYSANANKWIYFGYTYDGSCPATSINSLNSVNFYLNAILQTTGKAIDDGNGFNSTAETTTYNSSQRFRIASRWAAGTTDGISPVTIAQASIYNRALSAAEVLQNFNATRSRFGV